MAVSSPNRYVPRRRSCQERQSFEYHEQQGHEQQRDEQRHGFRAARYPKPLYLAPEDHADQTTRQGGFVAQEVEQVFPAWVREVPAAAHDKDLTIDGKVKSLSLPFEFDALVVEGLRQLRAEKDAQISQLQHALSEQKETNARLEARLAALEKAFAGTTDKSDRVPAAKGGPLAAR